MLRYYCAFLLEHSLLETDNKIETFFVSFRTSFKYPKAAKPWTWLEHTRGGGIRWKILNNFVVMADHSGVKAKKNLVYWHRGFLLFRSTFLLDSVSQFYGVSRFGIRVQWATNTPTYSPLAIKVPSDP